MTVKKTREHRFTWQDKDGKLRVVHLHLSHHCDGERDEVRVQITGDGVPLEVNTFTEDIKKVQTRSRL